MEGKKPDLLPAPLPGRSRVGLSEEELEAVSRAPLKTETERLYDSIIDEIEERTAFLDKMRDMGDLSHEATIKGEIAQRLREIKKVEAIMKEEKEEKRAAAAGRGGGGSSVAAAAMKDRDR